MKKTSEMNRIQSDGHNVRGIEQVHILGKEN